MTEAETPSRNELVRDMLGAIDEHNEILMIIEQRLKLVEAKLDALLAVLVTTPVMTRRTLQ